VSSARIGGNASAGRIGTAGAAQPGAAAPAMPTSAVGTHPLPAIRYHSTWPRGWMAAAVPQRVREFHVQISKAQMALDFLEQLEQQLSALIQACRHQRKLPSDAGAARLRSALQAVQAGWAKRLPRTLESLDESLHWSPVQRARKQFTLAGWSWESLQAEHARDTELVGFCLLGQEGAQGAWQARWERAQGASRQALAHALAPLGMQLSGLEQPLLLSVEERWWPVVVQRFMVKGNGKRFPAGQWVSPRLVSSPQALRVDSWSAADAAAVQALAAELPSARERVLQAQAAVRAFQHDAGQSLDDVGARTTAVQAFAQAFAQAGQMPAYDWILAVVPAVRAVSRRRVARLLQCRGALA
jgi:hypothetical protein